MSRAEYLSHIEDVKRRQANLLTAAAEVDAALLRLQRTAVNYINLGGRGEMIALATKARLVEAHGVIAVPIAAASKHNFDMLRGRTVKIMTDEEIERANRTWEV